MGPADRHRLEENKDLVRRLGAINDSRDWDGLDELLTSDFRRHSVATTHNPEITSREEFKRHEQAIVALYPDRKVTYERVIAEGDLVAASATFRGTNAELGVPVEIKYIVMMRIEDGRIAEIWVEWDNLAIQRQLGI